MSVVCARRCGALAALLLLAALALPPPSDAFGVKIRRNEEIMKDDEPPLSPDEVLFTAKSMERHYGKACEGPECENPCDLCLMSDKPFHKVGWGERTDAEMLARFDDGVVSGSAYGGDISPMLGAFVLTATMRTRLAAAVT